MVGGVMSGRSPALSTTQESRSNLPSLAWISFCWLFRSSASSRMASISAWVTAEAGTTTASGSRETATAAVRARPHRRNAHFLPCSFHHCLMPATSPHPEGAHHGQDQSNHHHHGQNAHYNPLLLRSHALRSFPTKPYTCKNFRMASTEPTTPMSRPATINTSKNCHASEVKGRTVMRDRPLFWIMALLTSS